MWWRTAKTSKAKPATPVKEGEIRSFGRIASRMTSVEQHELDNRLEPYLITLPEKGVLRRRDMFNNPRLPLVLEVGCGHGHYLWCRATQEEDKNFLGIEVYKNGLKTLVHKLEQRADGDAPVKNLKLCGLDARMVMDTLPDRALLELVVLYPDPWPKKRHNKRRIINDSFLQSAARIIQPGGKLLLVTDIADYAHWMLAHVLKTPDFKWTVTDPSLISEPPEGWPGTKYEQKAMREGRKPWYLCFTREDD